MSGSHGKTNPECALLAESGLKFISFLFWVNGFHQIVLQSTSVCDYYVCQDGEHEA